MSLLVAKIVKLVDFLYFQWKYRKSTKFHNFSRIQPQPTVNSFLSADTAVCLLFVANSSSAKEDFYSLEQVLSARGRTREELSSATEEEEKEKNGPHKNEGF